mgnify:CR=1 FL=1
MILHCFMPIWRRKTLHRGFLENNGIEKEEISIAPPEVIDMQAERYVDRNVAYRYNATSVITVTSKNVDRYVNSCPGKQNS